VRTAGPYPPNPLGPRPHGLNLSGVSVDLTALHLDPHLGEGWHFHTFTVTAWRKAEPWTDGRSARVALTEFLHAIAPDDDGVGRRLPPELWSNEAIGRAVLALGNVVKVNVDRPGFHAEVWL
jgi:hypothetical protein